MIFFSVKDKIVTKLFWIIFAIAILMNSGISIAQLKEEEIFIQIDSHALSAPPSVETSVIPLANYLTQPTKNDVEKARSIYRWITDRVNYDVQIYRGHDAEKMDVEKVLSKRTSTCDGYATLFEALAKAAGLEVATISGYVKGYSYHDNKLFSRPNHAWNAVKIDGKWRLIDSTWGAGYVSNGEYKKTFAETYFLASPDQLMFSHLPENEDWQLQSPHHLNKEEFELLPSIDEAFFNLGISGEKIFKTIKSPDFKGKLVNVYSVPHKIAVVEEAPLNHDLVINRAYDFKIQSEYFEKMAASQDNVWINFDSKDRDFKLTVTPEKRGELRILGKRTDAENYTVIFTYDVD